MSRRKLGYNLAPSEPYYVKIGFTFGTEQLKYPLPRFKKEFGVWKRSSKLKRRPVRVARIAKLHKYWGRAMGDWK